MSFTYTIEITKPSQTVPINLAQYGIKNMSLVEYYGEGLVNTSPLLFSFRNQPMNGSLGNFPSHSIPLLWDSFPTSTVFLNNPLPLVVNQPFNDSHQLQTDVTTTAQTNPIFTRLILVFRVDSESATQIWKMSNLEKSLRQA